MISSGEADRRQSAKKSSVGGSCPHCASNYPRADLKFALHRYQYFVRSATAGDDRCKGAASENWRLGEIYDS